MLNASQTAFTSTFCSLSRILRTVGRFNIKGLIKVAPLGIRLALAGKIPPLFLKPVPKVDEVRTIFETLEAPTL